MPGTSEPFAFSGNGSFDATTNRGSMSLDLSSFAQLVGGLFSGLAGSLGGSDPGSSAPDFGDPSAWRIEAVQDGDVMYMRFPAMASELPEGKSWVRMDLREAGRSQGFDFSQLQDFTSTDPREMLEFLRAASDEIETVGTEELRGVETTHYRAKVDLADYEQLVPADKREELGSMVEELLEQSGLGEMPVDIWLDGSGLVRKLSMSFSATQPGTTEAVDASVSFEIWDYGEDVEVELPPAAQVVDASKLG